MFFILHILLMITATSGLIAGVSAAIFFRRRKNWLKFHKTVNALSFGAMTTGIAMAFFYVAGSSGEHLQGLHHVAGLTAFSFSFITLIIGYRQFKVKNKQAFRNMHRWLGRVAVVILLSAAILGLKLINIL
ncbi:MAG TPA: hypothetical protein PLV50_04435 [Smithella sp.]|nr:hypothetical protein [Smithella sp.]HOG89759.1 hypothetical protein [Smithella sp.]HQH17701.1 hypothetical protein [Smithella sp.]